MKPGRAQLPLSLEHRPYFGRDSYFPGACNKAGLALVERWPNWPNRIAVISGPAGSGKTHLANIWAEKAGARVVNAAQFAVQDRAESISSGFALDGIDGEAVPEIALFHVLNRVVEAGATLLMTSRRPATEWRVRLPDLRSRLRLATPAALQAPDDVLLRKVMMKMFVDRQVTVDPAVLDFVVPRMERSFVAASSIVDALDAEALASGRRITRSTAARILAATNTPSAGEFPEGQ